MWVETGVVDWPGCRVMIIGDSIGIVIVLVIAKALIALAERHDRTVDLVSRWRS